MSSEMPRFEADPARVRYGQLLALITFSLIFQLAAPVEDWSRVVTVALQGSAFVLALRVADAPRRLVHAAVVVATAGLIAGIAVVVGDRDAGADVMIVVNLLLVVVAASAIAVGVVRHVLADRGVTLASMFGVLSIYLLLGMMFAFIYSALNQFGAEPVFAQPVDPKQPDFLYFSFSTLTTTGFGDITAQTGPGRATAIAEALIGQVYLVTVVAAIVSNLRPRRTDAG